MSADIKPGQYVTARHVDGDTMTGRVLDRSHGEQTLLLISSGPNIVQIDLTEWSVEVSWRDGIYAKDGAVRIRHEGRWLAPAWVPECAARRLGLSDSDHADWRYVGRGLSW